MRDAPVDEVKSGKKGTDPFFGRLGIFTLDQVNPREKLASHRYEGIVSFFGQGKSKYEIERKVEKRYWR